jgi:hypothetical protein
MLVHLVHRDDAGVVSEGTAHIGPLPAVAANVMLQT